MPKYLKRSPAPNAKPAFVGRKSLFARGPFSNRPIPQETLVVAAEPGVPPPPLYPPGGDAGGFMTPFATTQMMGNPAGLPMKVVLALLAVAGTWLATKAVDRTEEFKKEMYKRMQDVLDGATIEQGYQEPDIGKVLTDDVMEGLISDWQKEQLGEAGWADLKRRITETVRQRLADDLYQRGVKYDPAEALKQWPQWSEREKLTERQRRLAELAEGWVPAEWFDPEGPEGLTQDEFDALEKVIQEELGRGRPQLPRPAEPSGKPPGLPSMVPPSPNLAPPGQPPVAPYTPSEERGKTALNVPISPTGPTKPGDVPNMPIPGPSAQLSTEREPAAFQLEVSPGQMVQTSPAPPADMTPAEALLQSPAVLAPSDGAGVGTQTGRPEPSAPTPPVAPYTPQEERLAPVPELPPAREVGEAPRVGPTKEVPPAPVVEQPTAPYTPREERYEPPAPVQAPPPVPYTPREEKQRPVLPPPPPPPPPRKKQSSGPGRRYEREY